MKAKTELPQVFEEFKEAREQGLTVKELKESEQKIVGVYCTFMPEELIITNGTEIFQVNVWRLVQILRGGIEMRKLKKLVVVSTAWFLE